MMTDHAGELRIDEMEACSCARPVLGPTHMGFRKCKLCDFLIPGSDEERRELNERRVDRARREGLWPKAKPSDVLNRWRAYDLAIEALREQPDLTNGQIRWKVERTARLGFGNTVWTEVCRDARLKLRIRSRKGRRPNCVVQGCKNVSERHGYCGRHTP